MPTYAYRCQDCGETFERTQSMSQHDVEKPACPKCGSDSVQWLPARFVARTGKKS